MPFTLMHLFDLFLIYDLNSMQKVFCSKFVIRPVSGKTHLIIIIT